MKVTLNRKYAAFSFESKQIRKDLNLNCTLHSHLNACLSLNSAPPSFLTKDGAASATPSSKWRLLGEAHDLVVVGDGPLALELGLVEVGQRVAEGVVGFIVIPVPCLTSNGF